jgi:hypothetical protein
MSRNPSSSPSRPPSGSSGPPGSAGSRDRPGSRGWKVARFLLLALVLFAALFYPWRYLTPFYKDKVAGMATLFLRATHEGQYKSLRYDPEFKDFLVDYRKARGRGREAFKGEIIHYNMMILLAMILASPGLRVKKRLLYALIGFLILFVIHASQVALKAETVYSKDQKQIYNTARFYSDTERVFFDSVTKFFEAFGQQLLPFAVWILLCAPAILRSLGTMAPEPMKGKD